MSLAQALQHDMNAWLSDSNCDCCFVICTGRLGELCDMLQTACKHQLWCSASIMSDQGTGNCQELCQRYVVVLVVVVADAVVVVTGVLLATIVCVLLLSRSWSSMLPLLRQLALLAYLHQWNLSPAVVFAAAVVS
jgi:hypothetical protein